MTSKEGTKMRKHMKRHLKGILLLMLCIVLVVPAMNVSAATQRQKAIAAYKKYLSQSKVYVLVNKSVFKDRNRKELSYNGTPSSKVGFYLANIDNDGIPELIISANLSGEDAYTILTYRYGKIKRVTYRVHDAFRGYYPKTGIYIAKDKGGGEVYWRKNGTENEIVMSKSVYGPNSYRINSTPVSIKSFAAYRTRITNGTPLKIVKFYSNTAANRNQKLK